jgi:signal transduction histidine kinase
MRTGVIGENRPMSTSESAALPRSTHAWTPGTATFQRAALAALLLASTVEVVRLILLAGPMAAYFAVALGVVGAIVAGWRPWPGLVSASISPIVAGAGGWQPLVEWTVAVFVLFGFVLRGRPPVRGAIVVALLTYVGLALGDHQYIGPDSAAAAIAAIAGAALAAAIRSQQQYWSSVAQRADDAVATRESEATRRVAEERLRIARDLHDVVGHQVAVLGIQLGAVEVSMSPHSDATRTALDAARTSVKTILSETQQILAVLRDEHDSAAVGLRPAPGIMDLETLVESFRLIGLNISARLIETPIGIDPAVDVTVYRVVQEALTNAHRYGDGRATVGVALRDGRVSVDVSNLVGRRASGNGLSNGYGLVGMHERVRSAGGTLRVGPDNPGRFEVHAVLDASGRDVS